MSTTSKSETKTAPRKSTDLGRVFPCGVRIGKTPYGYGVFAFAFVSKGTPIARVSGHLICDPDYGSDYCIDAGNEKVLEPEPPFCYLNHACEPNCQLMQYVREEDAEESEPLETGELTEEDMDVDEDFETFDDDDCFYGDGNAAEGEEPANGDWDESEDEVEENEPFFEDDADAEIWVEAIRDIMPNEELTIDYSWPADKAAKCLCGQARCRGWIVDPAELDLLLEKQPDA